MLACNVSLLRRRAAITADVAEAVFALDAPGTGNVVFATLVDDPASVGDHVDAFLGQIMVEAASAAATVNAGLGITAAIVEAAAASDALSSAVPVAGTMVETVTAASTQDATVVSGVAYATWELATVAAVTLSGGNLVATNTGTSATNQGAHVASASGKTAGKIYFEMTITPAVAASGGGNVGAGIGTTASTYTNMGNSATTGTVIFTSNNLWTNGANTGINFGAAITVATLYCIACDLDTRKAWVRKGAAGNWNNAAIGSQNPAVGSQVGGVAIPAGTMVPFCTFGGSAGNTGNSWTMNSGASAFTGTVPSGFTSGWTA